MGCDEAGVGQDLVRLHHDVPDQHGQLIESQPEGIRAGLATILIRSPTSCQRSVEALDRPSIRAMKSPQMSSTGLDNRCRSKSGRLQTGSRYRKRAER